MNNVISLLVTLAAGLFGGISKKSFTDDFQKADKREAELSRHVFNGVASIVCAVIFLFWGGISSMSVFTAVLGTVFGLITALQLILYLKAMENGPWSYTTVIVNMSMLIPTLSGAVIWNETIKLLQYVGIAFMVACLILSVDKSADSKKASFKWLIYCTLSLLCTGLIGVMQKWHQSSAHKNELNGFLIMAFAVSFVYSAISFALLYKKGERLTVTEKYGKAGFFAPKLTVLMLVGGVCTALANKLNLYLSGAMDSAVFFPIVNGVGLMLTILSAVVIFRERLPVKKWIGVACGCAAVMLLVL